MDKEKQEPTAIFSCLTRKNSIIQSIIVSITKIYSIYSAFCKQTSLHGLKHTVAANFYFFERLLWFVLTISAFAGAVYCALNQLARYNSEPVVVSLQRDYRSWSTAFPAVTVCFLERIQVEKAKSFISSKWNVTEESDPEKYQYYYEFVELIAEVSFRRNLQNFWKYQSDDSVNDIDLLQLALDVYPDYPLETVTSDHGEIKWIQVMTEEGLCKSFNSQYAQHQKIGDFPWRTLDLMKCHYHSEACHVRISSLENGVRYFIHSPFDIATAISNPTGEIFAGDELITDYKVVEIEAANSIEGLRPEQRRCKYPDEWLGSSIRAYSFGLCQMHCRTRLALMFCGCRPYFHVKGDGDVCDAHGMACIGRNVEILINLPKNLAKCPCMPQCEESNYYSHTKKIINQNDTSEAPSQAVVRFKLMPPKFRLHRDIIFSLDDLFSSLGGTTALFVGASVLTVVETILFIIRCIMSYLIDWYHNRQLIFQC